MTTTIDLTQIRERQEAQRQAEQRQAMQREDTDRLAALMKELCDVRTRFPALYRNWCMAESWGYTLARLVDAGRDDDAAWLARHIEQLNDQNAERRKADLREHFGTDDFDDDVF
jgi:hypothetical protein